MMKSLIDQKTIFICITLLALAIIAITIFKISIGNLIFIAALVACPLLLIWMMKSGNHHHK